MQLSFELTPKQAEYIQNAHHRWNVACGAVRSGKSYCQIAYCIPSRLLERRGQRGLRVILGATRSNIERNILQPMRDIFGDSVASGINSQNYCKILGEKVYCIGADNTRQVAKIRGSEIAYCAIDEATDINEEVFEMLKSRLSLPWSCCDITTNPASPSHWFKKFLDSKDQGVDIYLQEYTLYDNPFLSPEYVHSLEVEYAGTVWFARYILGKWALAEGLIYPIYLNALETPPDRIADEYIMSVDYGTLNAFAALLWGRFGRVWYAVEGYYYSGRETGIQKTDEDYAQTLLSRYGKYGNEYQKLKVIVDPSAASFITALREKRVFAVIQAKNGVIDGIRNTARTIQTGKIKINPSIKEWRTEVEGYVWNPKAKEEAPLKKDDHYMDAMRYFVHTTGIYRDIDHSIRSVYK